MGLVRAAQIVKAQAREPQGGSITAELFRRVPRVAKFSEREAFTKPGGLGNINASFGSLTSDKSIGALSGTPTTIRK